MSPQIVRNCWIPGVILLLGVLSVQADDAPSLADYFGFHPVEVFKLSDRSQNMLVRDVNQDGKPDIVVVGRSYGRSVITV